MFNNYFIVFHIILLNTYNIINEKHMFICGVNKKNK